VTDRRVLVVVGGHPDRGDDAAGLEVGRRVTAAGLPDVHVVVDNGDPLTLIDAWAGATDVVIVDASTSGAPPGTILRLDATRDPVPVRPPCSSHELGPGDAVELARAIGRLPPRVDVWAIEAADCSIGAPLSPAVVDAVEAVTHAVLDELAQP
jgi:hydrogenase maturation protease